MRWCESCVLPDTRPNLRIAEDGICSACRSHGVRRDVDRTKRREDLRSVVAWARGRATGYDCVIPVSGGKDSTWQTVACLDLGLRPLAVTWRTPARTELGQRNLDNLRALGVDHLDYSISPDVEARFARRTFEELGSPAVPMHLALFAIPLTVAVRFKIPLVVWGENSAAEYGSRDPGDEGHRMDGAWIRTYGVTHGTTAADWVDADLTEGDLVAYHAPSEEELEAADVRSVFLGHFLRWDPEWTATVAAANGFQAAERARTGLYAFADIDDDFIAVHHWMKWYKFGFTRLFDNLSLEIRSGRIDRHTAIGMIRLAGDQRPDEDIRHFCDFVGLRPDEFDAIAERFRNTDVWRRDARGTWTIPDFLIDDWRWR